MTFAIAFMLAALAAVAFEQAFAPSPLTPPGSKGAKIAVGLFFGALSVAAFVAGI